MIPNQVRIIGLFLLLSLVLGLIRIHNSTVGQCRPIFSPVYLTCSAKIVFKKSVSLKVLQGVPSSAK